MTNNPTISYASAPKRSPHSILFVVAGVVGVVFVLLILLVYLS